MKIKENGAKLLNKMPIIELIPTTKKVKEEKSKIPLYCLPEGNLTGWRAMNNHLMTLELPTVRSEEDCRRMEMSACLSADY